MSLEIEVTGGPLLSFTSLRHDGEELLARAEDLPSQYCVHGKRAGITFLHPWANRLSIRHPDVPMDGNGLPLHGLRGDWHTRGGEARCSFPGHQLFPWPHEARVRWHVGGETLRVVTELRAPQPIPVVFGWHPYFVLPGVPRSEWVLELPFRHHLELDQLSLPTGRAETEPAERARLADRTFDDGYEGGTVWALEGGGRRIEVVHQDGFPAAQVFAPPDADIVSLEPMAAITDALSNPSELRKASTASATFTIRVSRPSTR